MASSSAALALLAMAVTLMMAISGVQGLGINCRGSGFCQKNGALASIRSYVANIQVNRIYSNGQHIACRSQGTGGICAFPQGTLNGISGAKIKDLLGHLANHGCNSCGSVPITFPASNDPKDGILTVNYVANTDNPCPTGLC